MTLQFPESHRFRQDRNHHNISRLPRTTVLVAAFLACSLLQPCSGFVQNMNMNGRNSAHSGPLRRSHQSGIYLGAAVDIQCSMQGEQFRKRKGLLSLLRTGFVAASGGLAVLAFQRGTLVFSHGLTLLGVVGNVVVFLIFSFSAFVAWQAQPMIPSTESVAFIEAPGVHFTRTQEGWLLCQSADSHHSADTLFLLYCGVKLDPTHYAGQASELAKLGISTLIIQSPLNLVFFPPVNPLRVIESLGPRFNRFFLGGHSLGAYYCCQFLQDSEVVEAIEGVAITGNWLRKAKPFDLSALRKAGDGVVPVALINGDRDVFVRKFIEGEFGGSMEAFEQDCKKLLPPHADLCWIDGGNHFGFCDVTFGLREGYPFSDLDLKIPREEQQRRTAAAVARLCAREEKRRV